MTNNISEKQQKFSKYYGQYYTSKMNEDDSHSWKVIHMSVKLVTVQNNDSKDKSVDWQMSN